MKWIIENKIICVMACLCATLWACGDDDPAPPANPEPLMHPTRPYDEPMYQAPQVNDEAGHWTKSQRSITLDLQDKIVLQGQVSGEAGPQSSVQIINDNFSVLTIHRPLLNLNTGSSCIEPSKAFEYQPKIDTEAILGMVQELQLKFDKVVVNVELLYPQRDTLYALCLNTIDPLSYFLEEHRTHTIQAFKELAEVSGIDAITVGVSLNDYYYLEQDTGIDFQWDYANLIQVYHEIYQVIKKQNADIKVGPGIRWSTLMATSYPEVAAELDLDLSDETQAQLAFETTSQRFVHPLLVDYNSNGEAEIKADYLAIDLRLDPVTQPFSGIPSPEDLDAVKDYFKFLPLVAHTDADNTVDLVFSQVDWHSSNSANAGSKAPYLKNVKSFLSHVTPLWVAWRRFSDLPSVGDKTCDRFVNDIKQYTKDYCFAGLVDDLGKIRAVFDELITNP